MYIVTCEEMKQLERIAENIGITESVMTENAALGALAEILRESPRYVRIFCGKGKNGGDGFAVARHLYNRGIDVSVVLMGEPKGTAIEQFNIIKAMKLNICSYDMLSCADFANDAPDLIIDAILGTGIHDSVNGIYKRVIEDINSSGIPVMSLDIPSGINGDTGKVMGCAIKAFKTVTFGLPKLGLYSPLSADYCGEVINCDISLPRFASAPIVNRILSDSENFSLPRRSAAFHKGNGGRALIIGGTGNMMGAPYMAASAAEKCGAGLITAAVPKEFCVPMMTRFTGVMCTPIDNTLKERIEKADAVLVGGGMGISENTLNIVETAIENAQKKLILDADALNVLSDNKNLLKKNKNIIITPHIGEMSRLTGLAISEITENRVDVAEEFASKYGCTVVLKGANTVVAEEGCPTYINSTGNPGMAKGGSGDVLAGMITGFCSTGIPLAVPMSVYLHGLAGDLALSDSSHYSITPEDLLNFISEAIKCI